MAFSPKLKGRYEPKDIIAEGGMGVVYRAIDLEMQSEVALKTIQQVHDPQQLEMFRKECAVLRKLRHPNVVDLYDYGVIEEEGQKRPFFVMPLLPGVTLDKLIRNQAARLTPERVVEIITQTCKGLQAAHELGLVHRDIKPSNIFVLDDDSVKLIDFGVVHVVDQRSISGLKGTLLYMSPEQIEMSAPTGASDIFSLAVVCYEALTRRRAFTGSTDAEVKEAILHLIPPPISELNPAVTPALSQVVHAAMAKQTWHRTSSARQFAEELQKAVHNQPIERFDPARIEPRIARAQKALENSEYDFASEILAELEAEYIHPAIRALRRQIDQALRIRTINRALESARHRFAEEEYPLALQKVEEVLRIEPANADALALKGEIDAKYKTQQIENWFRLAQDHVKNFAFGHARQALQNVLRLKPVDTFAIHMLSDVDRRESEYLRARLEKEELYKVALEAWHRGEVSAALSKLERVLELDGRAPEISSSEAGLLYQNLYNQVRTEHDAIKNAYAEANKLLGENDFAGASKVCEQYLNKYPGHALFQALKFDIGERQRQHFSAYIAKIDRAVEAEPDLDRKVGILSEALRLYPEETHFKQRLERVTQRRDLVASITQKVRNLEERGQYTEAIAQLEILRTIYPQYPGMDLEVDRISKRRDQQVRAEARLGWVDQIDRALSAGDFAHAVNLLKAALTDFPDDAELVAQERLARDGMERSIQAANLFEQAQRCCARGDIEAGLDGLWQAHRLDEHNALIRAVLVEMLLKRASAELDNENWSVSEQLVRQAIDLDPTSTQAKSLQRMAVDRKKDRAVDLILSNSRELQAAGDLTGSLATLEKGLAVHPEEPRLMTRKEALLKLLSEAKHPEEREKDLSAMRELKRSMSEAQDPAVQNSVVEQTRVIARKHPGDGEVESVLKEIEQMRSATEIFGVATISRKPGPRKMRPADASKPTEGPPPIATPPLVEPAGEEKPRPGRRAPVIMAISALALIAIAAAVWRGGRTTRVEEGFVEPQISIDASVPGAHLFVNSDNKREDRGLAPQKIEFPEGEFRIEATKDGYTQREPVPLKVSRGQPVPRALVVPLEPLPPIFRVSTDFPQASLDQQKIAFDGFRFETSELTQGPHTLNLSSPVSGTITVQFELAHGQIPAVRSIQGQESAVVVASLANSGQLYSTLLPVKVTVSDQPVQEVSEQGIQLSGLQAGPNQLVLEDKAGQRTETLQVDPNPGITVLVANTNAGNIQITANVPDATFVVEPTDKKSRPSSGQLKGGGITVTGLEPKTYRVRIQAVGYLSPEMTVNVQKGRVVQAKFTLEKPPFTTATLEIRGGTPDAELLADGSFIGKLTAGGDFTSAEVQPGPRALVLRKKDHEDRRIERQFRAGETIRLGEEVRLIPFGWLDLNVTPTNAQVTIETAGQPPRTVGQGEPIHVKAGRYTITGKADKFNTGSEAHEVRPGLGEAVNLKLTPVDIAPTLGPRTYGIEKFAPQLRKRADEFFEVDSNVSKYTVNTPGKFTFAIKRKGTFNNRARWYVNYVDPSNYIEYEIDEANISYRSVTQGKESKRSVAHGLNKSTDTYDVAIDVKERSLAISIGGASTSLDPQPIPGSSFLAGSLSLPKGELIRGFKFEEARK